MKRNKQELVNSLTGQTIADENDMTDSALFVLVGRNAIKALVDRLTNKQDLYFIYALLRKMLENTSNEALLDEML